MASEWGLDNLAIKTVGKLLKENGFEYLSVNLKPRKDSQFLYLKTNFTFFS